MTNGNDNKNKWIQIALIIAMGGFIGIKDITVPLFKSITGSEQEKMSQQVAVNTERITRLEMAVQKLETIPSTLAVQAMTLSIMAGTLEKIEKKLDEHMNKGK